MTLLLWLAAAFLYQSTRPHFGSGTVDFPGKSTQEFVYPFTQAKAPKAKFILKEDLELPYFYPTIFEFYPQDALWAITVNGHPVAAEGLPLSVAHNEGRSINLGPFLHPGSNQLLLNMEVFWGKPALRANVSPRDKYSLILVALVCLASIGTAVVLRFLAKMDLSHAEIGILSAGISLRFIYLLGTPYYMRAYDYGGHVDYLNYVIRYLRIPNAHENWEAFQPPLYYFVAGGMIRLLLFLGLPEELRYSLGEGFSFLCSAGVLACGLWIGRLLYPRELKSRLYLLAVLGVAPALVFNTSRLSNDVLLNLLEFLWLALLLHCRRQSSILGWLGCSLILGLALVTKANALALIPISLACVVLDPRLEPRLKIWATSMLVAIPFGIAAWYYLPRVVREAGVNTFIVGNLEGLSPKAHIDSVLIKSLIFNPFKVIRYPFAEPWGPHHEYFLEVFFKTLFLGEWIRGISYRWITRAYVAVALFLIPAFFLGIYRSVKNKNAESLPLLLTFGVVFAAHWNFVQIAPFISSQDFRYSVILLVPMVYFFIQGASSLPLKWARLYFCALQLVILNSAIYLLALVF